jgi:hypothetical protein
VTIVATIASGCGGSSSSGNGPQDSGAADVTAQDSSQKEAAAETGPEAAPEAAACVPDADIAHLTIPDASIADSGASTDGCYSCIQTSCGSQLSTCSADCACNSAVGQFLACVPGAANPISCVGPLAGLAQSNQAVGALTACVGGPLAGGSGAGCLKACGVSLPGGGDGGGPDSGGDTGGGGDTGTDGPTE